LGRDPQEEVTLMPPKIAVLLDENTSAGGAKYEAHKGYFRGIIDAGGAPFGIPYAPEMRDLIVAEFDGLLTAGGGFSYPADWYADAPSHAPASERLAFELAIVPAFLAEDKPVLGICAGMQMLAAHKGAKLTSNVASVSPHNRKDLMHDVVIETGTLLHKLVGADRLSVNTFHNEAIVELAEGVVASAHAEDGVIEAVELPHQRFALGVQWHQELFAGANHPGARIFEGFVRACAA
jgi:putative glutamine amidotransferase